MFLPSAGVGENTMDKVPYYLPPTNIWNTTHHNAYPAYNKKPDSQQKDIAQTQLGSPSKTTPVPTNISLGKTFVEKTDIHPLQPFEGDVLLEGRWGNTLRLGSTVTAKPNNWSSVGKCGDLFFLQMFFLKKY